VCSGASHFHAVRTPPDADLVPSLIEAAKQAMSKTSAQSAFVLTAVGSLTEVTLRMAATDKDNDTSHGTTNDTGKKREKSSAEQDAAVTCMAETSSLSIQTFKKHFEIVSLVGTFSRDGGKHLHMSVSDSEGVVLGGHLVSGKIFTTLELVFGTIQNVAFTREIDEKTGYLELTVQEATTQAEQRTLLETEGI